MNLDTIRQEIDHVDQELVAFIGKKRMQLVNQVVAYKKSTGRPILDTSREDAVLQKAASCVEDKSVLNKRLLTHLQIS